MYPLLSKSNANQNWLFSSTGTLKKALAKSTTVKYIAFCGICDKIVYGLGTRAALAITAEFTACRSCTNRHVTGSLVLDVIFFTGKIGVRAGESWQGIITLSFRRDSKNRLYPSQCLLLQGILRLTWPVIRLWSDYNWFTTFNQPNIIFVFCPQFWRYFCQDRMNVCGRNRSVLMFLHCILDNSSHSSLYGNIKLTFLHKNTCISTVFLPVWFFQSNLWQKDIFSQTGLFLPISVRWPWLLISEAQTGLLSNTASFVFLTGMPKAHTHFHSRKSYQTLSKTFSAPLIHSSSYWYMHISMNVIHWYWYWYCSIFANFKIFCAQSESLICCSSPVNPKRASSEFQI